MKHLLQHGLQSNRYINQTSTHLHWRCHSLLVVLHRLTELKWHRPNPELRGICSMTLVITYNDPFPLLWTSSTLQSRKWSSWSLLHHPGVFTQTLCSRCRRQSVNEWSHASWSEWQWPAAFYWGSDESGSATSITCALTQSVPERERETVTMLSYQMIILIAILSEKLARYPKCRKLKDASFVPYLPHIST